LKVISESANFLSLSWLATRYSIFFFSSQVRGDISFLIWIDPRITAKGLFANEFQVIPVT